MSEKLAFLFPGQGSQSVGMGFDFAQENPDFMPIFQNYLDRADQALGFKLSDIIRSGPADELKKTDITQPALLTVSSAMGEFYKKVGKQGDYALGHSLGEYSALVYAGAIKFEDAVKVVNLRGKFMSEAVPYGVGGMGALVGASEEDAKKLCARVSTGDKLLSPSVFNAPGQVVLSGHSTALDEAEKLLSEFPSIRKMARLEVSGPFHCRLLESAGAKLREALKSIEIQSPKIPVIFNVSAKTESNPSKILELIVEQVSRPVLWEASVREARALGCSDFVECGSGKVLSGLWKRI